MPSRNSEALRTFQLACRAPVAQLCVRPLRMRYFIYVSETKVRMLFPQIPKKFLGGLSGELKVSLGIGEVKLESKADAPTEIYSQALAVENYLESKHLLGNPLEHGEYFRGTHQLSYGLLYDYASDIALFGTHLGPVWLAMIGARSSLIGEAKAIDTSKRPEIHALNYYELCALNYLITKEGLADGGRPGELSSRTPEAIKNALPLLPKSDVKLHYVAKSLRKIQTDDGLFVLASPLYVSFPPTE